MLNLGLVGAGSIAALTAMEFASHPEVRLAAVADTDPTHAQALARAHDIPEVYAQAADLFANVDLDAVYIAVPNALHAPFAHAALTAGKHVMLDKPFALDVTEAQTIATTARANGRVLMLGMNQRFTRAVQRAKSRCDHGELGKIYHANAFWRRRCGIPRIGSWFTNRSLAGGGALLDIGVHMLDACLYVLDAFHPESVSGAVFTEFGNRGLGDGAWGSSAREHTTFDVDDFTTAFIRLEGGAVLTLQASWAMHQQSANAMGIELYGTDAGMSVFEDRWFGGNKESGFTIIEGKPTEELPFPHCSRAHHFVNVLLERETLAVTVEQALCVQRIIDGIYQSAKTHREVRL